MKKRVVLTIAKIISFIVAFVASFFIFSTILNRGNTDMTKDMANAAYPVIHVQIGEYSTNCLHGYAEPMNPLYMRDSLTPIDSSREVKLTVDLYHASIDSCRYELRSVDGSRLLERTEVSDYSTAADTVSMTLTLKDLMEKDTEYLLDIILGMQDREVHYYTRIVQAEGFHVQEKLDFIDYFHNCTFDKEQAANITKYLESNAKGDNTTLGRVTLNSSFKQITWADMKVQKMTEPCMTIRELDSDTATVRLDYILQSNVNNDLKEYRVTEYYRVRYTKDRMYMLQFERNMNQIFNENDAVYTTRTIGLGIQQEQPEIVESDDGRTFAYVVQDRLFCYNGAGNQLAYLYGFYNADGVTRDKYDERILYNQCDVEILNVDETGNVCFMVYGYMNRGDHEGRVGVSVNYYNSLYNTVEEKGFITYDKPAEILREELRTLHYVSRDNLFYMMLDCAIYRIDLANCTYEIVGEKLTDNMYSISEDSHMILVQNGQDQYSCSALVWMNLNTHRTVTVEAGEGNYIRPLGFMGDDIVYGIARREDIYTEASGITVFPMYEVRIQNEIGEILKTYAQENVYVVDGRIHLNQLVLKRVSMENGTFRPIADDQILNNRVQETPDNTISVPVTQNYEKVYQINLAGDMNVQKLQILTPRLTIYEGNRELSLQEDADRPERYYIFTLTGLSRITTDVATAVTEGLSQAGTVMTDQGMCIFSRGGRSSINQIMAIRPAKEDDIRNSLAVCLDTILEFEGIGRSTAALLEQGRHAMDILAEAMPDAHILELNGCELEAMLFYLNRDIPVLTMLSPDRAVLLVGYNTTQIAIMDPATGTIYKKTMAEASAEFAGLGNVFITYVR